MRIEHQRQRVVSDLKIAGTRGSSTFQNLVEIAARLCEAQAAAITVIDHDTRWFHASTGINVASTPRKGSICDRVLHADAPVVIDNWDAAPSAAQDPLTRMFDDLTSYVGVPIEFDADVRIGSLFVIDRRPLNLAAMQLDLLKRLATLAVDGFRLNEVIAEQQEYVVKLHAKNSEIETKRRDLERVKEDIEVASDIGNIGFWTVDFVSGDVVMSSSLRRILELSEDATPEDIRRIMPPEDWDAFHAELDRCAEGASGFEIKWSAEMPSQQTRWLHSIGRTERRDGVPVRVRGCTKDISDAVRSRHRISRLAAIDTLTGIHNRRFLPMAFLKIKREIDFETDKIALLLVDVDHFKLVNDTKGHDVGDEVLVAITKILADTLRDGDVSGRLGGDEFLLMLRGAKDVDIGAAVSERLAQRVANTPFLQQFATPISLSIGYVDVNEPSVEFADALKHADLAVYEAKRRGRACAVPYAPFLGVQSSRRDAVLKDVDSALRLGHIAPAYQPMMCLRTGRVIGMEALARWRHPQRGVLEPADFVEALEHPTFAKRISDTILRTAIEDVRRFDDLGVDVGRVSINVSESQLVDENFGGRIKALCTEQRISPKLLGVEFTEKALLSKMPERVRETIRCVSEVGVGVALDDFGSGYASLTLLREVTFDLIKIERSLISRLSDDPTSQAIVSSLITMARNFDLAIAAKGVESADVGALLRDVGCDFGQGYFYSQPLFFDDVLGFMARRVVADEAREAS